MLHKTSTLMTGLIIVMGAAWFALHTYGSPKTADADGAAPRPEALGISGPHNPDGQTPILEADAALIIAHTRVKPAQPVKPTPTTLIEKNPADKEPAETKSAPKSASDKPASIDDLLDRLD